MFKKLLTVILCLGIFLFSFVKLPQPVANAKEYPGCYLSVIGQPHPIKADLDWFWDSAVGTTSIVPAAGAIISILSVHTTVSLGGKSAQADKSSVSTNVKFNPAVTEFDVAGTGSIEFSYRDNDGTVQTANCTADPVTVHYGVPDIGFKQNLFCGVKLNPESSKIYVPKEGNLIKDIIADIGWEVTDPFGKITTGRENTYKDILVDFMKNSNSTITFKVKLNGSTGSDQSITLPLGPTFSTELQKFIDSISFQTDLKQPISLATIQAIVNTKGINNFVGTDVTCQDDVTYTIDSTICSYSIDPTSTKYKIEKDQIIPQNVIVKLLNNGSTSIDKNSYQTNINVYKNGQKLTDKISPNDSSSPPNLLNYQFDMSGIDGDDYKVEVNGSTENGKTKCSGADALYTLTSSSDTGGGGGGGTTSGGIIGGIINNSIEKLSNIVDGFKDVLVNAFVAVNPPIVVGLISLLAFLLGSNLGRLVSGSLGRLLFFWLPKRRRYCWGKILSTISFKAVNGAKIKLFNVETQKVIAETFSDQAGNYYLPHTKGQYQLEVSAPEYANFQSPTILVEEDKQLQIFDIILKKSFAQNKIKLDLTLLFYWLGNLLSTIRMVILIIGSSFAIYSVVNTPNKLTYAIVILYAILWILEVNSRRQAMFTGQILNNATLKPLAGAYVSLNNVHNQLLSAMVTTKNGKFSIPKTSGSFYYLVTKNGYLEYKSEPKNIESVKLNPQIANLKIAT